MWTSLNVLGKIFLVVFWNFLVGVKIEYLSQLHCNLKDWVKYIKTQSETVAAIVKMPVQLFTFHCFAQNKYKSTFKRLQYCTLLYEFKNTVRKGFRILLTVQCRIALCHTVNYIILTKKPLLKIMHALHILDVFCEKLLIRDCLFLLYILEILIECVRL